MTSIGEKPDDVNLENMFREMDKNNNGKLHLDVSTKYLVIETVLFLNSCYWWCCRLSTEEFMLGFTCTFLSALFTYNVYPHVLTYSFVLLGIS